MKPLLALAAAASVLTACSPSGAPASSTQPAAPTKPKSLPETDYRIKSAALQGDELRVEANAASVFADFDVLDSLADVVESTGRAMHDGAAGQGAARVTFRLTSPGTDRLGKEVEIPVLIATFPAADLRAANFDNLQADRTLSLATSGKYLSATGRDATSAWCRHWTEANDGATPRFCSVVG